MCTGCTATHPRGLHQDVGLCCIPCYPLTNQIAALSAARSVHDVGAQAFDSHSDLSEDEPDSNTVYVGGRCVAIRCLPYCEPLSVGMSILRKALSLTLSESVTGSSAAVHLSSSARRSATPRVLILAPCHPLTRTPMHMFAAEPDPWLTPTSPKSFA